MNPQQQSQMVYSAGAFQPPSSTRPTNTLLTASAMPTPENPYAVPQMMPGPRALTWPPSLPFLMKREASGRCQPLG
jgi:hypothetical protein